MNTIVSNIKNKKVNINKMIDFLIKYLKLDNVNIQIFENDNLLKKFSTDDVELQALLIKQPIEKHYTLNIVSNCNNLQLILCHEIVHLLQYESNKLSLDLKNKTFTWEGKKYDNKTEYFKRPWEIEAFSKQKDLLKIWKKYNKNGII